MGVFWVPPGTTGYTVRMAVLCYAMTQSESKTFCMSWWPWTILCHTWIPSPSFDGSLTISDPPNQTQPGLIKPQFIRPPPRHGLGRGWDLACRAHDLYQARHCRVTVLIISICQQGNWAWGGGTPHRAVHPESSCGMSSSCLFPHSLPACLTFLLPTLQLLRF